MDSEDEILTYLDIINIVDKYNREHISYSIFKYI